MTTGLSKGTFHAPQPEDLRSPCPILNSLANHGIIPRDGRNITADELQSALQFIGLGRDTTTVLVHSAFKVHSDDPSHGPPGSARSGLRDPHQTNEQGIPVLNLDQTGRPHAIEHDVSLTRQDRHLGDCVSRDPVLYDNFQAACVGHGGLTLGVAQFGRFRHRRYGEQKQVNEALQFGKREHFVACAEAAAIQCVFGRGLRYQVPRAYIEAVFGEERLPYAEGWRPRRLGVYVPEIVGMILAVSWFAWPF